MSKELFDLTGRTTLITGSSRGIGYALAEGLGKAGSKIILNGTNEKRLTKSLDILSEKNISVHDLFLMSEMSKR